MIKITFPNSETQSAQCRTVVDFYTAIFQFDEEQLFRLASGNCAIIVHGNVRYEGRPGLTKMLKDIRHSGLDSVSIDNMIADTKHAAINGIIVLKNGSQVSFADFLTFSAEQKIQQVDAYPVVTSR